MQVKGRKVAKPILKLYNIHNHPRCKEIEEIFSSERNTNEDRWLHVNTPQLCSRSERCSGARSKLEQVKKQSWSSAAFPTHSLQTRHDAVFPCVSELWEWQKHSHKTNFRSVRNVNIYGHKQQVSLRNTITISSSKREGLTGGSYTNIQSMNATFTLQSLHKTRCFALNASKSN